jgi:hypothetical protein
MAKNCSSAMFWGFEQIMSSRPNETCTEPLSLAVEQFLEMVRFEQRARLAELPEELVRGQDVFL